MADMVTGLQRKDLEKRLGMLKDERSSWVPHWREVSTYLLPRNGRYMLADRNRGSRRHNSIYDSTGTRGLNTLTAGMMSGMTSPARPWLRFVTADRDLMKSPAVKEWLTICAETTLMIFHRGNTYQALEQIYKEEGAFGTAATVVLDDFRDVMRHYPLTAGEYCIAQNWRGEVDTLYREFEKPVGSIVREFGVDKVSSTVKRMYDNGMLDSWVTLVHAIEPREDRDPSKRDAQNMPWRSVYYEAGNGNENRFLRESGFKAFPSLAVRWSVEGGDVYGNGPGMAVLGDVKALQQMALRRAQAVDEMSRPAVILPTSMKNRELDGLPGGVSFMDGQGTAHNLRDVRVDLSHLLLSIQDTRQMIREGLFADLFLMISSSDPSGKMTATEVASRQEEKMLMLGPVIERNANELLTPLVTTTFQRALAAGLFPPPPPELNNQPMQVEYISVLAQAQRAIATNGIDRLIGNMGVIAGLGRTDVLDRLDVDYWADAYSDALGVDPQLIVPAQTAALVRQERAKQQAAAAQAQMANVQADTAQKLAKAPSQGGGSNVLQDLTNQFSGYGSPSPVEVGQ